MGGQFWIKGLQAGMGPGGPKLGALEATRVFFDDVAPANPAMTTRVRATMRMACFISNSPVEELLLVQDLQTSLIDTAFQRASPEIF